MSFMTLKNVSAKALAKNFQKKISWILYVSKIKGSILRFFFARFFALFFYFLEILLYALL